METNPHADLVAVSGGAATPPSVRAARNWPRLLARVALGLGAALLTLAGLGRIAAGNIFCFDESGPDSCADERLVGVVLLAAAVASAVGVIGGRRGHLSALLSTLVLASIAARSLFMTWQAGIDDPYVQLAGALRAAIESNAIVVFAALAIGWAGGVVRLAARAASPQLRRAVIVLPVALLLTPSFVAAGVARPLPIEPDRMVVSGSYEALLPPGYARGNGHYHNAAWLGIALHNSFYDHPIEMPPEVDLGPGDWYDDAQGLFALVHHVIGIEATNSAMPLDQAIRIVKADLGVELLSPVAERAVKLDGAEGRRIDYLVAGDAPLALWSDGTSIVIVVAVAAGRRYTVSFLADADRGLDESVIRTFLERFRIRG